MLLSIAKLQNLKAIHNYLRFYHLRTGVVINRKTTKFESNSQLNRTPCDLACCCYQSQNYKIWKQFTTLICYTHISFMLLSIAKLQNLKAIHNYAMFSLTTSYSCYQSQNYKIWKQFTTKSVAGKYTRQLLSIAKLQNLKAIHNPYEIFIVYLQVVINRKTTKFESNSQRATL